MRAIPYDFVLEELASLKPYTKPMFGCTSVYVGDKIMLILRDKEAPPDDKGVWLATTADHHASLLRDFPNMRSIGLFGDKVTGWQVLAENTDDFEEAVMRACALVLKGDERIGKIPKSKLKTKPKPKPKPGPKRKSKR